MQGTIGIRQEDKDKAERRAALTPDHVRQLIGEHGLRVIVQPADNRIFHDQEYLEAGAQIDADLRQCNIIFGVKEVPIPSIVPGCAHIFFSHTIKAQAYNMPMLKAFLDTRSTLIDYELIVSETGKRTVFFGKFAGYAGMIDSLWAWGQRLALEGIDTPFARLRQAKEYASLEAAKQAIRSVGEEVRRNGLPQAAAPLICGFTGRGNVAQGAQEIYDLLPVQELSAQELMKAATREELPGDRVYKVVFSKADWLRRKNAEAAFDDTHFKAHPEQYESYFADYLPFLSMVINGIFWLPGQPRLISKQDVHDLYRSGQQPRLRVIGDISCDIDGSVEVTLRATSADNPVFVYDADSGTARDGFAGHGPVVMAVDKLPTELPREASQFFGDALLPYVPALAATDFTRSFEELSLREDLKQAIIAHNGQLTPRFSALRQAIAAAQAGA